MERTMPSTRWNRILCFVLSCLIPALATAHPGSGIVVDRLGQTYFVDMVSGIWKLDARGSLTHLRGQAFHWMTLDATDRFASTHLPSGSDGDFERIGKSPTLILTSDFPIVIGRDGNLYFPSHNAGTPLQIQKMTPAGQLSILAVLPFSKARPPVRDLNGLAAGPDGSLYYTEDNAIRRISKEGRVDTVAENFRCTSNAVPLLRGLDISASGSIYVAATGCRSVLKVTPAGVVTTFFAIPDSWSPTGIAVSGNNVYALEFQHADSDDRREMLPRVRRIGPDGRSAVIANDTRH
jgi:DNA-binding beta-propeller fold protein YncE